jgi:hypothetical protein
MESMRQRDPILFEQYVGLAAAHEEVDTDERPTMPLSERLQLQQEATDHAASLLKARRQLVCAWPHVQPMQQSQDVYAHGFPDQSFTYCGPAACRLGYTVWLGT